MADKYNPGMEFQSWRSLPRITDFLDRDGVRQFMVGSAINALTGINPTKMAQDSKKDMGQTSAPAVPSVPQAPAMNAAPVAPVAPPVITQPVAPVNPMNPITLPPIGQQLDQEGSVFDDINGLRR